ELRHLLPFDGLGPPFLKASHSCLSRHPVSRSALPAIGFSTNLQAERVTSLFVGLACGDEGVQLACGFAPKSRHLGDLLDRCRAQPLHRSKLLEQSRFAALPDARKLVKKALGYLAQTQSRIVSVREPVRFISN